MNKILLVFFMTLLSSSSLLAAQLTSNESLEITLKKIVAAPGLDEFNSYQIGDDDFDYIFVFAGGAEFKYLVNDTKDSNIAVTSELNKAVKVTSSYVNEHLEEKAFVAYRGHVKIDLPENRFDSKKMADIVNRCKSSKDLKYSEEVIILKGDDEIDVHYGVYWTYFKPGQNIVAILEYKIVK